MTILIVLFFGQGFFMNVIRMAEPSYLPSAWYQVKKKCKDTIGDLSKAESAEDNWAQLEFLAKSHVMTVDKNDDSQVIQETEFEDDEDSYDDANHLEKHLLRSARDLDEKENLKKIDELQKKVHREEHAVAKSLITKEMVPLTLFLSTSLNVEMVYTILHGICKFTLLNFMRNEFTADQMKQFKAMEYRVDRHGDTTITLREI